MSPKINIFVTGATGYIGGSVVAQLLEHPDASSFQITALVRSLEKAAKLESIGVKAVVGSFTELDKLEMLSSEADVVFAMADADNLDAVKATLRGLKKRFEAAGHIPIYIHTSGTGVLIDDAMGMFAYDTVYNDCDADRIETLPPTQPHRNVDLEIVKADQEGYVKSYIVLPSTIYGIATGKLVDLGIQHPYSQQLPMHIKASMARGQAGMVGEGKNIWPHVHIDEVTDLYIVLYNSIVSESTVVGHGREGYYFGENGEYAHYEAAKAVSEALVAKGLGKSLEPTPFTDSELNQKPILTLLGTNSRCRGDRSRSIGWKPTKTTKDMLASIEPELDALLKASHKL